MVRIRWPDIFKKFHGIEYNEKGATSDEGLNCFSLIVGFLNETGHEVPTDKITGDYSFDNIYEKWKEDDKKTVSDMANYLVKFGRELQKKEMKIGDVLILEDKKTNKQFPAIYGGGNKIYTMIKNGSYMMRLNDYKITRVFRGKNQ